MKLIKNILIIAETPPFLGGRAENTVFYYIVKFLLRNKCNVQFLHLGENVKRVENFINKDKLYNQSFIKIKKTKNFANKNIYQILKKVFNIFSTLKKTVDTNNKLISLDDNKLDLNIKKKKYNLIISQDHISNIYSRKFISPKRLLILPDSPGERLSEIQKNVFFENMNFYNFFALLYAYLVYFSEVIYWKNKYLKKENLSIYGERTKIRFEKITKKRIINLKVCLGEFKLKNFKNKKKSKPKIIFAGSLDSTASRSAYKNILMLSKKLESEGLTIHISGGYKNDIFTSFFISQKNIIINNKKIKNFEDYLSKFDIFLFPTVYSVGVRTRICSALAAGNYCIVSDCILENMPELKECRSIAYVRGMNLDMFHYKIREYQLFSISKKMAIKKIANAFYYSNYMYKKAIKNYLLGI